jgi:hypothetical protein
MKECTRDVNPDHFLISLASIAVVANTDSRPTVGNAASSFAA